MEIEKETLEHYHKKALRNLSRLCEEEIRGDEQDLKECLTKVLAHGGCEDVAEAIVEIVEVMTAHILLKGEQK